MNRLLRHPAVNAVGLSVYSLFFGILFLGFPGRLQSQTGLDKTPVFALWDSFLRVGGERYIAYALLCLTVCVLLLLFLRHKPYDEYHTAILVKCLAIALVLTLAAIAVFFVIVLCDPAGVIGKFTFFVSLNWATVVVADLIYLLLCGRG